MQLLEDRPKKVALLIPKNAVSFFFLFDGRINADFGQVGGQKESRFLFTFMQ